MATVVSVANETRSSASRITTEGKKITYQMTVIQQPERARACGSGAKSSADRRPVDPPPIVELRVFEGDAEITFSYNANFFLYATLENARTIAQGRVPQNSASIPVLTGTPVAGMAYLDRPTPAGYFIFPDLSVRHEGKYRLAFALYEELKDAKDADSKDSSPAPSEHSQQVINGQHVSHRLEVKSSPFTVFSAKKFPGLTESTALSRMVAEQGCRVRIRRDVRMRRRDNKPDKGWGEDYEEEYERARRTATPDYNPHSMSTPQPMLEGIERPRSVSNASNASMVPPRRPSLQDMAQSYQQAQSYPAHMAAPQTPQGSYTPQMPYGPPSMPAPQYQGQYSQPQPQQQPPPPPPQAAPQPQGTMMQPPPQAPYQQPPPQHPYASQSSMQMPQGYGYNMQSSQQYSQPQYESQHHVRHESMDYSNGTYRRASMPQPQHQPQQYHPSQMMSPFATMDNSYSRPAQPSQANAQQGAHRPSIIPPTPNQTAHSMNGAHELAPLKPLQGPVDKIEPISPAYTMPGPLAGSVSSADPYQHESKPDIGPSPGSSYQPQGPPSAGPIKRSFSQTFDTQHIEQPMRQGARPDVSSTPLGNGYQLHTFDNSDEETLDERAMTYRRADGTQRNRRVPYAV
ncbi:velvet factor-domain-containing protein [Lineolata rhizophorae]|uniref:Velvet factor-domain-containing protein n=1 Tax=Lineolata rhizophorae TaxID=578093 RepID=A0A6A6PEH3_9PEZI|nr:velvet factor-domain-containing protein [Lineolata rhizophorae]